MSPDSGMALGVGIAILLTVLVPSAVLVWFVRRLIRSRKLPSWALWAALPCALAAGAYFTFFVVFDDLGSSYLASRRAPTIELRVPNGFRGSVYAFFDSKAAPMMKAQQGGYVVPVPASGKVVAGGFPGIDQQFWYVTFLLTAPDGQPVPQGTVAGQSGDFDGVFVRRFFVGTQAEADQDYEVRSKAGTVFDEQEVYRSLSTARAPNP
jgi:hypothetical protein